MSHKSTGAIAQSIRDIAKIPPDGEITERALDLAKNFYTATAKKDRQWYELDNRHTKYGYSDFWEPSCPGHHRDVAYLAILGRNATTIAALSSLKPTEIIKILNHEPVAAYVEQMRERIRLEKEKFFARKGDTALEGFNVMDKIIRGEVKAEKTRFDASKHAMSLDPQGRFEPYAAEQDRRIPLTTDSLREYINKNKAIEAKFVAIEDDTDAEDESLLMETANES